MGCKAAEATTDAAGGEADAKKNKGKGDLLLACLLGGRGRRQQPQRSRAAVAACLGRLPLPPDAVSTVAAFLFCCERCGVREDHEPFSPWCLECLDAMLG